MAKYLNLSGIVSGSFEIFIGFWFLGSDSDNSLSAQYTVLLTVGIPGVLAFIRHVIFHKSDAERLGWQTDRPDWMFEVGFANLAFGVMAFLSLPVQNGTAAHVVCIAGYAVYLLQAAILHGYRYFTEKEKQPARLWRSTILTSLFAGMMFLLAALIFFTRRH